MTRSLLPCRKSTTLPARTTWSELFWAGANEADNTVDNVYTRAAALGREWRDEGILQQDSEPSIYAYSQTFKAPSGEDV